MTSGASLIETRGLAVGYGGRTVARDISVSVRAGEVVCLLGPNGSGKTTLFKTLLGLLEPLAGSVSIAGEPIEGIARQRLARSVAYVPQAHVSVFPYQVIDMVLMGRTAHFGLFSAPNDSDRQEVRAALDVLGIGELAQREYTRISGGQRQLALIARALAQDAPAIIMDEPTASLDFGNQALVLREITRLAGRGFGIVLSTHNPDHAFAISGRVILLHEGHVVANGLPREVLTSSQLEAVYRVPVTVQELPGGRLTCVPELS